ncbi:VCBS repeat-containing protein [Tunicatimonas pelagia]|uniref:VCBS repeat-containing protein n=1 Tax=Tunicatimonas pelagia TaxID=931531 RepID=UPI00266622B8|nr:VCBS repeat-containing protein [Tunicatimonas pelagia]WKN44931.1 VCBS repeat-containing protein [Tunicatimonas pelagia]
MTYRILISGWFIVAALSCNEKSSEPEEVSNNPAEPTPQHYRRLSAAATNVNFSNNIRETENFNYFLYPFIYFGGGVAIGDINNDTLPDIYFTSNMSHNALYLNQGGFKFREIGKLAGVEGIYNRWTTGATMVDINHDGFLDIYVSVAGPREGRRNLLYINNQDNTFREEAEQWGIADNGHSIQSVFFDYDSDGDLDLYVGNYPPGGFSQNSTFFAKKVSTPELSESDRLYRNEGDHFVDVTQEAGLLNYGLTLGLSVADFNNDHWPDLYVSNDFNSPDYLYINQKDGTFSNEVLKYMRHTSNFGMGTDAADINNDGFSDLIQLDMMGSNNEQQKVNMSAMNPELFYSTVDQGLHHQYMKNTLQLNTGLESFMDIGELAGIAYTDWSWGALLMDMNNDGHKDVFITNGMRRNVNDNDFNAYFRIQQAYNKIDPSQYLSLLQKIPVHPVENFAFLNNGDLTFRSPNPSYGLNYRGFSNGAAYADLDLDGDLDMVVNNLDAQAHIFENVIDPSSAANFLKFRFEGEGSNPFGIGTQVCIYADANLQCQDLYLSRGYQSSAEPVLHFGLGDTEKVDSAQVVWPDGRHQTLHDVAANQLVTVTQSDANSSTELRKELQPLFTVKEPDLSPGYRHRENEFNDFEREVLLPHRMSQFGPALAVADVNQDGLDDFYVGGAMGVAGSLYLQGKNGAFRAASSTTWVQDKAHEDVSAVFLDANNDKFPDLYVVSGGNERPAGDNAYQDRLYLNNQQGKFSKAEAALPEQYVSGSQVRAEDFDSDGDTDLFIGGRQVPGKYPLPTDSYLLRNDSNAERTFFTDVTTEIAPQLSETGMVTDASWSDIDGNGWPDLVIVGEWMSVTLMLNDGGIFSDASNRYGLGNQVGWWNAVVTGDIDQDGDLDVVVGNLGLNYKYKASAEEPFKVYADDFDENGSLDIVLGYYEDGELYPLRGRECSSQQMPSIKQKIPNYTAFAQANLGDIYSSEKLSDARQYQATTFANTVFINESGKFVAHPLPNYAQASSVNAMVLEDLNEDGHLDLFLGGNLYDSEVETPRNDASYGLFMPGNGSGHFSVAAPTESGIAIRGEIRAIVPFMQANQQFGLLIARNDDTLVVVGRVR